jgi:hypothetical protein
VQTESIAVTLRPRQGWEAVDLGFRMVRTWWRPLFGAWALTVLPLAALIQLALYDRPLLALAILWWLKPVYDRVALYVLSEALFGDVPTVRETLRALPGLLRTGIVPSLLWLRLSPLRALHLPVLQLEHLRGDARARRTRILSGRESGVAIGLHIACLHFELIVFIGLLELLAQFAGERYDVLTILFGAGELEVDWMLNGLYVLAVSAIEPFYVGGGFALYINRRVYLEGWDIDLVFRGLARRLAPGSRLAGPAAAGGLALLLLCTGGARAEEAEPVRCEAAARDAGPCIDAILGTEEFATEREVEWWWPRSGEPDTDSPSGAFLEFILLLARLARVMAWLLLAAALGAILYLVLRHLRARERVDAGASELDPAELRYGADTPALQVPDDVVAAARARFASGDPAGALSLLYRGAVTHLVDQGVELPASATEEECARIARRRGERSLADDFGALVRAWQRVAYARRAPDAAAFDALCQSWQPRLRAAA